MRSKKTDYVNSAYSVARCYNDGRAYRLTDTETGDFLEEADEQTGMQELYGL